jgi:hypothetical protein
MPSDQNQGNYNPEYMETAPADNREGNRDFEFEEDPAHPTSPSAPPRPQDRGDPYSRLPQDLPPGETPSSSSAGSREMLDGSGGPDSSDAEGETMSFVGTEGWLISKAHEIYTTSTDYLDANITNIWEVNLAHFNNEHAPATKFRTQNWKRSKVFRPKTRSMTKSSEAALTNAMFSTTDVVDIQPEDEIDPKQIASAAVNKEILQYRLDRKMPWYQTVIGAFQSTKVYGLTISFQYWDYHEDTDIVPEIGLDGGMLMDEEGFALGREQTIVRRDDLRCDLVAPENFRFDPMCDWRDPATTSPYLLYMMPVYAVTALENMEKIDNKTGQPVWKRHALGDLLATRRKNYDRTRQAREGRERIDPADEQHGNSYTMLWAHMNIVNINGEDMLYWTMGTELLLTDPVPLNQAFPHLQRGERPFTVGFSTIEAFRNYPAGDVEQASGLQQEINLVANQRLDNVKLVLNKRYYVKRGSQVDLDALIRNVSGGGVMMNDPEKDVKTIDTRDVTGSSYQEQDRLSVELDELTGTFSQTSVQSNQNLNETVGGMEAMQSGAGAVQDYGLRIFFETWAEPTLRQLVRLIQYYETDQTILALAQKKAELWQKFGIDEVTDELLRQELTVRVNVGMGNTDPQRRVEKLMFAVKNAAGLPKMAERMKSEDIADEIFGTLGYKNAVRFFRNDQEQKAYEQENPPQPPPEIKLQQEELKMHTKDNEARHQREVMKLEMEAQTRFAKLALEKNMKFNEMMQQLGLAQKKDATAAEQAARKDAMAERKDATATEIAFRQDRTTRQGKALDNVVHLKEMQLRRDTGAGV